MGLVAERDVDPPLEDVTGDLPFGMAVLRDRLAGREFESDGPWLAVEDPLVGSRLERFETVPFGQGRPLGLAPADLSSISVLSVAFSERLCGTDTDCRYCQPPILTVTRICRPVQAWISVPVFEYANIFVSILTPWKSGLYFNVV